MKDWQIFLCIMFGFIFGLILGAIIRDTEIKRRAINHGAAIYNPTNGSFQWKQ